MLYVRRLNLIESQLWNEDNWRGKYIGVVPRRGKEDKVSFAYLFTGVTGRFSDHRCVQIMLYNDISISFSRLQVCIFFSAFGHIAKILKTCPPVASQCWYCGQCCPGNGLGTPPTSLLPDCQGAMSVPHQRGEERAAVPHCRDHSTRLPSEKQYVIV